MSQLHVLVQNAYSEQKKMFMLHYRTKKQSYVCQSDLEELHFLHLHENSLYIAAIKSQQKNKLGRGGGIKV